MDFMKNLYYLESMYKLIPTIPVVLEINGRSFHTWTRGLKKPYDEKLHKVMQEVMKKLMREFSSNIGYTYSDEIVLVWIDPFENTMPFGGKNEKLVSAASSLASVVFNDLLNKYIPEKKNTFPTFTANVIQIPGIDNCKAYLNNKRYDAIKKSYSSAARIFYTNEQCYKKKIPQLNEMLLKQGVAWDDYPIHFKSGMYAFREEIRVRFGKNDLKNLPKKHNARKNPNHVYTRNKIILDPELKDKFLKL